jgi:uncharacterized protein YecT (DUF1311 family)
MTFLRRAILVIASLVLAAPAFAGGLPVTQKTVTFKNKDFDVSVAYPQTGVKAIDAALLAYAQGAVQDFKALGADRQPQDPVYTLDTTYSVERNDGKVFAVLFTVYTDTGGAHPNHDFATLNFLLPDGAQIFLPEIVDGARGIRRVSDLVTADLMKRLASGAEPISDSDTIKMGSGPYADNFADFILEPNAIRILFPPYQVASYAAGEQESTIPLASLKDVIRSDWRAPAASFDCALAKSRTEHAICADAALARLDREVSEQYAKQLRLAYEAGAKDKLKQDQRAFVAARDKSCAGAADFGACLSKAYAARLVVLQKVQ